MSPKLEINDQQKWKREIVPIQTVIPSGTIVNWNSRSVEPVLNPPHFIPRSYDYSTDPLYVFISCPFFG